jgi:hypothetical protein
VNVLSEEKKQQAIALGRLGWSLRRIQVPRTFGAKLRLCISRPPEPRPGRSPSTSVRTYRELIEAALARGRNAMAFWQDLVDGGGFNPKINRCLVFDLATGTLIGKREDALFLGPGGTGKSHLAQAISQAAILQGYRVLYREIHVRGH